MKLLEKGAVVLSTVLVFQLSFYTILLMLLLDAESLIAQGDNDRAIHKEIAAFSQSMTNTVLLSGTFVFLRTRELFKRTQDAIESSSRRAKKIQSLPGLTPEDKRSAEAIARSFALLQGTLIESVNLDDGQLSLPLAQHSKQLSSKVLPLVGEIQSESVGIVSRHDKVAISVSDLSSRRLIAGLVAGGIAGTILLTIVLYLVFAKYIVGRLEHLVKIIDARATNRALLEPLPGKDEFSLLDTQFRKLSQRLSETAKKEKDIFECMPVALFVCSDEWLIETVNETACKLLQFEPNELVATSLKQICDSQWLSDRDPDLINRCTVFGKNTEPIDVDLSVSEFLQQGTKKRLVCIVDAREQAEVERLKQHFVAMVSHDIRTPLSALKSFLGVVEDDVYGKISERGKEAVKQSQASADALLRLTECILDLARTEHNMIAVDKAPCSLNDLIANALDAIASDPRARNVELTASNAAQDDTILADESKLLRALIGLLNSLLAPEDEVQPAVIKVLVEGSTAVSIQLYSEPGTRQQDKAPGGTPGGPNTMGSIAAPDEDGSKDCGEFEISRLMIEALGGSVSVRGGAQAMRCITINLPSD